MKNPKSLITLDTPFVKIEIIVRHAQEVPRQVKFLPLNNLNVKRKKRVSRIRSYLKEKEKRKEKGNSRCSLYDCLPSLFHQLQWLSFRVSVSNGCFNPN